MVAKGYVEISLKEYSKLQEDSQLLDALRICGVDNWEGWGDAVDLLNNEDS